MRGLLVTFLITVAILLQGCGKGASPTVGGGPGGTSSGTDTQALYEGNCNLNGVPFGAGDGSVGNPYLVCNNAQLLKVSEPDYLAGNFLLVKDLNLTGAPLFAIGGFTGTFDGNNHTLSNLGGTGLFQSSAGTIKNLTVLNASVNTSFFGAILVGWNQAGGIVSNCHVTGAMITGSQSGGIAGRNDGTITRSSANVSMQGPDNLGGLVGLNKGTITRSYAMGSIVGNNEAGAVGIVGGLVGDNYSGTISDSYSTASAQGRWKIGGFFGQNEASIVNSYATGAIGGSGTNLGGFGGLNTGTVTSSYWNTETSGMAASSGGAGKTTVDMNSSGTYVGWDFSGVWSMASGFPKLL